MTRKLGNAFSNWNSGGHQSLSCHPKKYKNIKLINTTANSENKFASKLPFCFFGVKIFRFAHTHIFLTLIAEEKEYSMSRTQFQKTWWKIRSLFEVAFVSKSHYSLLFRANFLFLHLFSILRDGNCDSHGEQHACNHKIHWKKWSIQIKNWRDFVAPECLVLSRPFSNASRFSRSVGRYSITYTRNETGIVVSLFE